MTAPERCVTHHFACDCREAELAKRIEALTRERDAYATTLMEMTGSNLALIKERDRYRAALDEILSVLSNEDRRDEWESGWAASHAEGIAAEALARREP